VRRLFFGARQIPGLGRHQINGFILLFIGLIQESPVTQALLANNTAAKFSRGPNTAGSGKTTTFALDHSKPDLASG
jgi:hypothetical protein